MKPTIGRIVMYRLDKQERQLLINNPLCNNSEVLPAIVVGVKEYDNEEFPDSVNLQVFPDGNLPPIYVKEAREGSGDGQWSWPVIENNPVAWELKPATEGVNAGSGNGQPPVKTE